MAMHQLLSVLLISIPLLFFFAATANRAIPRWWLVQTVNAITPVLSVAALGLVVFDRMYPQGDSLHPWYWLNPSLLAPVMLVLVSFIGLVITRYSRNYLDGESRQADYLGKLQFTLGAVSVVLLSNHLLVLVLGWTFISLGLHGLLLFYPERPRAVLAAHKKFLFARLAEACLLTASLLLYAHHGTWAISEIVAAYPVDSLSGTEATAAVLLAITALIKCAQLPVHGWLMQVMEAPTPVSALLHAGIVNLGGYLLLLFAPLLVVATAAQWLLLIVGGLTLVLASLVMMTRISIKVKLAWSTSAQMALMLVECALGLFELALLHLLAHSCYKAYAFLNAGSTVEQDVMRRLAPSPQPTARTWLGAVLLAALLVLPLPLMLGGTQAFSPWLFMMAAIGVLLAERGIAGGGRAWLAALLPAALMLTAYALQKLGAGLLAEPLAPSAGGYADAWVMSLAAVLFGAYWVLRYRPRSSLAHRFTIALFAGFYLDEWSTRTTLRIWPAKLPVRINAKTLPVLQEEMPR